MCLLEISIPPVSAGFDAAEGDQLGGCHVSPGGYAQMTYMLSALAGGRLVIALEVRRHLISKSAKLLTSKLAFAGRL